MNDLPNFDIVSNKLISTAFLSRSIFTFQHAADYIQQLPYRRNLNKTDLTTVFTDNCGTCSTKHALLKQLADENNFEGIQLILSIFRMNGTNTPQVAGTLQKCQLDYLPEAHNYLRFGNRILDYTSRNINASDFENDIIKEIPIEVHRITDFKVQFHKEYIRNWLMTCKSLNYTIDEIWTIREQCIADLVAKS